MKLRKWHVNYLFFVCLSESPLLILNERNWIKISLVQKMLFIVKNTPLLFLEVKKFREWRHHTEASYTNYNSRAEHPFCFMGHNFSSRFPGDSRLWQSFLVTRHDGNIYHLHSMDHHSCIYTILLLCHKNQRQHTYVIVIPKEFISMWRWSMLNNSQLLKITHC